MPCSCAGYRTAMCKCNLLTTGYDADSQGTTLLTGSKSLCQLLKNKPTQMKPSFVVRTIEKLYEQCATYNLKYCHIKGFRKHDGYIRSTVKDFIILACFLIANFVVFLIITAKTVVHLYHVVIMVLNWIVRSITAKQDLNETPFQPRSALNEIDTGPAVTPRFRGT